MAIPGIVFSEQVIHVFQKSEQVKEIGTFALRCSCIGTVFLAFSVPVNMLYQSIRKAGVSSFLSMLRSGLMFIPTLIISTHFLGIVGIQISQPLADMLTGVVSIPFVVHFLRKEKFSK